MVNDFDKALKARVTLCCCTSLHLHGCIGPLVIVPSCPLFCFALQEVGDFENWVKVMEWDMQAVATALEAAAGAGAGSTGGAAGMQQPAQPQQRQ